MGLRGAGTGTGGSSRRVQREHGRGLPLPKSPAGPPGPLPTRTRCVCSRCRWGCLESRGMSGGEITDLHNFAGLRWSREVSTATRSSVSGVPNTPRRGFSRSGARLSGAPCRREAVPPRNLTRGGGAGGGGGWSRPCAHPEDAGTRAETHTSSCSEACGAQTRGSFTRANTRVHRQARGLRGESRRQPEKEECNHKHVRTAPHQPHTSRTQRGHIRAFHLRAH